MRFIVIDPARCEVKVIEKKDLNGALRATGLRLSRVDFATLFVGDDGWGLQIVVYEKGLRESPSKHRFFSLGESLFAGSAIIFAFNNKGDTVTLPDIMRNPPVTFYRSYREAEAAIRRGELQRPQITANGKVVWEWRVNDD